MTTKLIKLMMVVETKGLWRKSSAYARANPLKNTIRFRMW